ncbi:hypothetical protein WJM97_21750 [Okeanomitos corallinicola TIOX110]|uniref:Outer membrane protein beta-barrel domain-containing protein n=1 Tax=Okeanomitos corallinicola TIOX110 TaxID=3133117 RepID=A0ABZ2URF4_9CYAN
MNTNNISPITPNRIKTLSANTLKLLILSTLIGINPAFAGNNPTAADLTNELTSDSEAKLSEAINQAPQTASFQIHPSLKLSPAPETISEIELSSKVVETLKKSTQTSAKQIKKPQEIAQVDPSTGVGDSFDETNRLREELLIEPIVETGTTRIIGAPASSAGTPTAYGASWRQAFIGGGLYFPFDGDVDGSFSVGFGLGDAVKAAGLEVSVNILSVGGQEPNFGDFAESGTVGLKLHRYLTSNTAVAVGWSNAIKWGEADNNLETIYGVVTQRLDKLTVSLGLGSGSYRSKGARAAQENDPNFFGSVGYRFIPQASFISSWTGRALNVGASFAPFENTPIVINTIFTDVTDNMDESGFSLTAGYSINF